MKNNDEMYQSLLSRYDEYQEKKKKRTLLIKRTVPVLAAFVLVVGIGLSCWKHFGNMNSIPMVSETIDESIITVTTNADNVTTEVTTQEQSETQTSSKNVTVTTAVTASKTTATADKVQTTTIAAPIATNRSTAPTTAKTTAIKTSKTTKTTVTVTHTQPATSTIDDAQKEKPSTSTTTDIIQEGPGVATTSSSSAANPEPSFNAQPIIFNSADEAIDTIKHNDISSYAEEYRNAYRKMFDRLNDDGVVYRPVTDNTDELEQKDTVILLPNAAYEDTGIMYKVVYNGNTYQVSFRYADTSVIKSPYNVPKYLYDRFKRSIHDEVVVGHQTYSIIYSSDQSQVSAAFFIDEEHYFYTSAYTTKDELIAFLELLDYESVIL